MIAITMRKAHCNERRCGSCFGHTEQNPLRDSGSAPYPSVSSDLILFSNDHARLHLYPTNSGSDPGAARGSGFGESVRNRADHAVSGFGKAAPGTAGIPSGEGRSSAGAATCAENGRREGGCANSSIRPAIAGGRAQHHACFSISSPASRGDQGRENRLAGARG